MSATENTAICDKCGHAVAVSEWPFCPHGAGLANVIADDVPGGFVAENGFDQPRKFYSKSEHLTALKAEGCEIRAKWAGPLDKYLSRWDVPSQYTLDAAQALVSRRSRPVTPEPVTDALPAGTTFTTKRGETFTYPVTVTR